MATQKHVHKFKRLKYKTGTSIFFCALPDCTVKMNPALCLGKRSICWICGSEFILTEYTLRLAKPHCEACHKPKNKDEEDILPPATEEQLNNSWIHEPNKIEQAATLSLAERLTQTIQAVKTAKEQEEKDEEI